MNKKRHICWEPRRENVSSRPECSMEARPTESGQRLGPTAALLVSSSSVGGESGVMSMADSPGTLTGKRHL